MFTDLLAGLWGSAAPLISGLATTVIVPAVLGWLFMQLKKLGINVDESRRASYTATAQRVGGELVAQIMAGQVSLADLMSTATNGVATVNTSHPAMQNAIGEVLKAAPQAVKHFNLGGNTDAIGKKILGEVGKLIAGGAAGGPAGIVLGGLLKAA